MVSCPWDHGPTTPHVHLGMTMPVYGPTRQRLVMSSVPTWGGGGSADDSDAAVLAVA